MPMRYRLHGRPRGDTWRDVTRVCVLSVSHHQFTRVYNSLYAERDCICIADLAMIRDHRSWLLWETRRKVITDKPPYCVCAFMIFTLSYSNYIDIRSSVFDLKRDSFADDAHRRLDVANLTCHAVQSACLHIKIPGLFQIIITTLSIIAIFFKFI